MRIPPSRLLSRRVHLPLASAAQACGWGERRPGCPGDRSPRGAPLSSHTGLSPSRHHHTLSTVSPHCRAMPGGWGPHLIWLCTCRACAMLGASRSVGFLMRSECLAGPLSRAGAAAQLSPFPPPASEPMCFCSLCKIGKRPT